MSVFHIFCTNGTKSRKALCAEGTFEHFLKIHNRNRILEAYLEPCQKSKMQLLPKIVNY